LLQLGLATIQILGESQNCHDLISPPFAGDRPAFKAGFVFLGLHSIVNRIGARPRRRVTVDREPILPIREER
jgi:hypothetical protein